MIDQNFPLCENISVDYAIMEKADEIFVLPASFGWSDLGTWGSLHENLPKDAHNNTVTMPDIQALPAIAPQKHSGLGYPRLDLLVQACYVVGYDFRHFPLIAAGQ